EIIDLKAVDNDTVWVLTTSYVDPKMPDGDKATLTLLEFKGGVWSARPSNVKDMGNGSRFLRVGAKVYVYAATSPEGLYSPADDWSLATKTPATVFDGPFAGPDGRILVAQSTGLYTVSDQGVEKVSDTRCGAAIPTPDGQLLCADSSGGLGLIRFDA